MDDLERFRRLFDVMQKIKAELRARNGDQRRALIELFNHKNAQVRLHAAIATLAIAPDQARGVLCRIKDQREHPQERPDTAYLRNRVAIQLAKWAALAVAKEVAAGPVFISATSGLMLRDALTRASA